MKVHRHRIQTDNKWQMFFFCWWICLTCEYATLSLCLYNTVCVYVCACMLACVCCGGVTFVTVLHKTQSSFEYSTVVRSTEPQRSRFCFWISCNRALKATLSPKQQVNKSSSKQATLKLSSSSYFFFSLSFSLSLSLWLTLSLPADHQSTLYSYS